MSTICNFEDIINKVFLTDFQKYTYNLTDFTILLNSLLQIYSSNPYLAYGSNRKKTFKEWNSDETLIDVANENGFYYTGVEDETICVGCGLGLKAWTIDDSPMMLHVVHSPHCSFVTGIQVLDRYKERVAVPKTIKNAAEQLEAIKRSFSVICDCLNKPGDAIMNARGIGHSDSMICLGIYRYLSEYNKAPTDTILLLRSIMLIDDILEANDMTENDLPPFVDFLNMWKAD